MGSETFVVAMEEARPEGDGVRCVHCLAEEEQSDEEDACAVVSHGFWFLVSEGESRCQLGA